MALPYISPSKMEEYRRRIQLFAKNAPSVDCIRSHYHPDRSGVCDLTGAKDQEEIFVLANRADQTMKVCVTGMQIVANILDINGADQWYESLREQRKQHRERLQEDAKRREEEIKSSSRTVLVRRKTLKTVVGDKNS
jgi:hypothetical protein